MYALIIVLTWSLGTNQSTSSTATVNGFENYEMCLTAGKRMQRRYPDATIECVRVKQ